MPLTLTPNLLKYKNSSRGGVIPYCVVNGKIHFLLAKDSKYNQLSDFGGGVKQKENALTGGIREFREESNSIFDDEMYRINYFEESLALTDEKMSIIFLPLEERWLKEARKRFDEKLLSPRSKKSAEVGGIKWVSQDTFKNLVYDKTNEKVWSRIQNFMIRCSSDFEKLCRALKIIYPR